MDHHRGLMKGQERGGPSRSPALRRHSHKMGSIVGKVFLKLEGLDATTETSRGVDRLICPSLCVVRVPRLIAGSPQTGRRVSTVTE